MEKHIKIILCLIATLTITSLVDASLTNSSWIFQDPATETYHSANWVDADKTNDSDWDTGGYKSGGCANGEAYMLENRTLNSSFQNNSEIRVQYYNWGDSSWPQNNYTIPQSCWNYSKTINKLMLNATSWYTDGVGLGTKFFCYSGTEWIQLTATSDHACGVGNSLIVREIGVRWNDTITLISCNLTQYIGYFKANATFTGGNINYYWYQNGTYNDTGEQFNYLGAVGNNITLECNLTEHAATLSMLDNKTTTNDVTNATLQNFSLSSSTATKDSIIYAYLDCVDAGGVGPTNAEFMDTAGNKFNYSASYYSGTTYRASIVVNSAGTWNYTAAYCMDLSGNVAQNKTVNLTVLVTSPNVDTGSPGSGSTTVIQGYDQNFTSTPNRVYEIFAYPLAGQNWTYTLKLNRIASTCNISAPFTCIVEGTTLYIEYPFNDSIGAYGDIRGEVQAMDSQGYIMRTPIQISYINFASYISVDTKFKVEVAPLFANDEEGNIVGLRLWWIILILLYASTKYK